MTSKALIITSLTLLLVCFRVNAQLIPPAPTSLQANAESDEEIVLQWEDNSNNEDFFVIERSVGTSDDFEAIAIIEKDSESFLDEFVGPKTTYFYRVKARNSTFFGVRDSDYSNVASATTPGPPEAPSNLSVSTLSKTSIRISWKEGSDDTENYRIERSLNNNNKNFKLVTNVPSSQKDYVDGGLNSNTRYFYRVRARNEYGNSGYSQKRSAVTFQFPPTLNAIADPDPILENTGTQTINLSGITAGGSESQKLTVTASSDNKALIPNPSVNYDSPNKTASLSYKPVSGAYGSATITVTVKDNGPDDPPDNINRFTRNFTVVVEKALPDLIIQNETVPGLICAGELFQVSCDVKNQGFAETPVSSLSVYYSATDNIIDESDILLGVANVPALDPDQTAPVTLEASLDEGQGTGPYYIIFKVDHNNEIEELNDNNNAKDSEFDLCLPDLIIENQNADQLLLSKGQDFNVSFDLTNQGDIEAPAHNIKYYLAKDRQTLGEEEFIGETAISSIDAGESRPIKEGLTIPPSTEEGSYFLVIRADSENEVIEKSEDNNIAVINITIQNLPDLNIVESSIDHDLIAFGQTVLINVTVVNSGVMPAESSMMRFYLSSDSLVSPGDLVFDSEAEIPELPVGGRADFETLLNIPEEFEEGEYYIIAFADSEDIVWENNELNNYAAHEISILSDIPPVITGTDFPEYRIEGLDNTVIKIQAEDDVKISSVNFKYKGIRNTVWDSTTVNEEGGYYQVSLPGAIFDELGLEYYFEVFDDVGLKATSDTGFTYIEYPNEGLLFPGLTYGKDQSDYQLVAIPLDLTQKGIDSIFTDDLGPYNKSEWRLFTFNKGDFVEYGEGEENLKQIEIGQGYWLIIRSGQELDTGEGRTVKANQNQLYEITLTEGWNQIGNPYNFDFKWSDVLSANGFPSGISGDIKIFDKGFKSSDVLKSFQGGFVQSNTNITLKIPITRQTIPNGRMAKAPEKTQKGWYVGLGIGNNLYRHEINGFGMAETAAEGMDRFDETHLPDFGFLTNLSIKFNNHQFIDQRIAKDIVPIKPGHVWDLEIENESADQYVYLSWNAPDLDDNDKNLVLYNPKNGLQVDMLNQSGLWIDTKNAGQMKIIYGDVEFLKESSMPSSIVLGGGYPNPFHHTTKIPLALPDSISPYAVYLRVYNNLGQDVKTLMRGEYKAGLYEIEWDGSNNAGDKVKPGIYFYQLKVENDRQNQSISGRLVFE